MDVDNLSFQSGVIKQALPPADCTALLDQLPGWHIEAGDIPMLTASFRFPDFARALAFANRVGALAEQFNHHPELTVAWGETTVRWWTHTADGIATNDVVLARETSRLAQTGAQPS